MTSETTAETTLPDIRVLFVGSSGGHLAQLLPLRDIVPPDRRAWVTFDTGDARGALEDEQDVEWAYFPTVRNVRNLIRNTGMAWRVLRERRPHLIVSTGAAVALPYFFLSRILGGRSIYIEVYDRIDSQTLSARLCSPFADVLAVQWPEQRSLYRETVEMGPRL